MSSAEQTALNRSTYKTAQDVVSISASRRRTILTALWIFGVALAIRVLFFAVQVSHGPAMWSHTAPMVESEMGFIATNLAQGRGFSSPFGLGSTPSAWVPPLIPLLWALIIRCVGSATGYTARIIGFVDTVPSACCVVVYWLIARHVLRARQALRPAAILVAAIFCVWPDSLYALDNIWYFPWQELATAVMVLLGMRWIDRPSLRTAVPLGIVAGFLALINVTPLPIFAVVLLLPLFESGGSRKRILGYGAVGAGLALLIVIPWLIRNAIVMHAFVPMRSNGGFVFLEGNNPDGAIRETQTSLHPFYRPAEYQRYQRLGEIEYVRQGFREACAYIRAHPLETLERTAERAYVIWLTDAFDQWPRAPIKYWQEGRPAITKNLSATLAAWGTISLLIWASLSGRLSDLPYKRLFLAVLFFLPLPYYFTLVGNKYSEILRSWLLLLTILALSGAFRRVPGKLASVHGCRAAARS